MQSFFDQLSKVQKDLNLFKPTKSTSKLAIDELIEEGMNLYEEVTGSPLSPKSSPTRVLGALKSIVTVGALPHDDDKFWKTIGKPGSASYNLREEILSLISDIQEALSRAALVKGIQSNLDNL